MNIKKKKSTSHEGLQKYYRTSKTQQTGVYVIWRSQLSYIEISNYLLKLTHFGFITPPPPIPHIYTLLYTPLCSPCRLRVLGLQIISLRILCPYVYKYRLLSTKQPKSTFATVYIVWVMSTITNLCGYQS